MSEFVTDTHPLVWYLTKDKRLSAACLEIFQKTDTGEHTLWIPAIVLVEVQYLVERSRFPQELLAQVYSLLLPPTINYRLSPLDLSVIRAIVQVSADVVPEMPDRLIAATAVAANAPLLSRDHKITAVPNLSVIW